MPQQQDKINLGSQILLWIKYWEWYIRNVNEALGGSGMAVCTPNSACLEVNLPSAKPGIVYCRATWEQTVPAKTQLVCSSSVASTTCSRRRRPLLTPFTGDSSWHFSCSQRAIGKGNYLSVFGGCRLCCCLWWYSRCQGLTSTTCLHAGQWSQVGGGELCLSLPMREHAMDSPVQTQKGQWCLAPLC